MRSDLASFPAAWYRGWWSPDARAIGVRLQRQAWAV